MFADAGTSVSSRFSVKSSNHSGRSRKHCLFVVLFFLFCFLVLGDLSRFPDISSSLREFAGFDEFDESCANDVEDELVLELDDNPATTTSTTFSVLNRNVLPIFGRMWLLTTGPLIGVSVLFAELT